MCCKLQRACTARMTHFCYRNTCSSCSCGSTLHSMTWQGVCLAKEGNVTRRLAEIRKLYIVCSDRTCILLLTRQWLRCCMYSLYIYMCVLVQMYVYTGCIIQMMAFKKDGYLLLILQIMLSLHLLKVGKCTLFALQNCGDTCRATCSA
jgi:hypothetical protein